MEKISVIGAGYVGLVQGVVLAEFGQDVLCADGSVEKIKRLRKGQSPIYEPGLEELIRGNMDAGRLRFTADPEEAVRHGDVLFIAVGTPLAEDGGADLRQVMEAAKEIGRYMDRYKVVVDKSTVPVGTARRVRTEIGKALDARGISLPFDVVSNPEFLREGRAVTNCMHPDRIVIGTDRPEAAEQMRRVYQKLDGDVPFLVTGIETAEMMKYASNTFLAVKISFINELALLCEKTGADVLDVARGMGLDPRIAPHFLHAGPGYGGSCFPKDAQALADTGRQAGEPLLLVEAAINANQKQKQRAADKVTSKLSKSGDLTGKVLAVWGLTFKPETDDLRDAPALDLIRTWIRRGAHIRTYCPKGMPDARETLRDFSGQITFCDDEYGAADGADAAVLMTEWKQFAETDPVQVRERMRGKYFFDFRNLYADNKTFQKHFEYFGLGR